jgi:hypothetical protein
MGCECDEQFRYGCYCAENSCALGELYRYPSIEGRSEHRGAAPAAVYSNSPHRGKLLLLDIGRFLPRIRRSNLVYLESIRIHSENVLVTPWMRTREPIEVWNLCEYFTTRREIWPAGIRASACAYRFLRRDGRSVVIRGGLEKPSTISIPCEPSCDQANVSDHDPRFG